MPHGRKGEAAEGGNICASYLLQKSGRHRFRPHLPDVLCDTCSSPQCLNAAWRSGATDASLARQPSVDWLLEPAVAYACSVPQRTHSFSAVAMKQDVSLQSASDVVLANTKHSLGGCHVLIVMTEV